AELYLRRRERNRLTRHRLLRRTGKIIEVIKKYKGGEKNISLLDIGAADGAMLSVLRKQFGFKRAIGAEPNVDLVRAKKDSDIELINSAGENLPFAEGEFDVVLLSAVIEHVSEPSKVISESYRVLSPGGLLIVITVVPWMDRLAEKLKVFPPMLHCHFHRFNLKKLKELLEDKGFKILELGKFALVTSGFIPLEGKIEKFLSRFGTDFLMTYELAAARKKSS
ncbi:MAG: class I SAM-dependent methyltransferase, partial [Planctomycetota bacterium]|nr:class I SAM-dependent methyltransferase [Planctomycetota bacterium]